MSGPAGSQHWMYNAGGSFYDYTIDQSLRLQNGVTQNLTVSSAFPTATDRKKVTISFWYKRSLNSPNAEAAIRAGSNGLLIRFNTNGTMYLYDFGAGSGGWQVTSTTSDRLHRDPSAFYHFALILDSTQATASDRAKFYVNGELWSLSTWGVGSGASRYPTLNASFNWHTGSSATVFTTGTSGLNGYVADFMSIDGQDVSISDLGETVNGVWVAKEYTGSFGNAGFHLDFADDSAIGNDVSGNNVDFTADSGFAAHDVVPDSPTNNFATLNAAANFTPATLTEGNLKATPTNSSDKRYHSTFPISSGKWYCEIRIVSTGTRNHIGFWGTENTASTSVPTNYARLGVGNSSSATSGTFNGTAFTASAGDILTYAFDADDGKLYFGRNAAPTIGATADFTGLASDTYVLGQRETGTLNTTNHFNFGQDDTFAGAITAGGNSDDNGIGKFKYAPPSGFLAMCSANLPELGIGPNSTTTSDQHFNTVLYTGTGASNSITGVNFQSDFTWIKSRSSAYNNVLWDTVRGATKQLISNSTGVESTQAQGLTSFDSDGFTLGTNGNINNSGSTYVGWNWLAGGTAVSNTNGSITSSVSANQDAGFSIVSYTGTGANATIGHGLASAPEMLIIKTRDSADNWPVYHAYNTSQPETDRLLLSTSDATFDNATMFNDTAPTSSVFSVGTNVSTNKSGDNFICYAFHSVEGHLKCGSYAGNGSTDGTFVYTGFRPAFVLLKVSSAVNNWFIYDNKREGYNQDNDTLSPNLTTVEDNSYKLDLVSNGFKIRGSNNAHNQSGQTFIYLAFAEAPFKYANAR